GHGRVVEGVVGMVGGRRLADIGGHFQVQAHGLAGTALPVVDADDGVDAQVAQEDDVHDHSLFRCRATIANSSCRDARAAGPNPSFRRRPESNHSRTWIPACAGMTKRELTRVSQQAPIRAMLLHALLILTAYLVGSLSAAII